jgi:sec-independent protein translocase protein TatC
MTSDRDSREMPFLDHLEELRVRLFWVGGALGVGFLVGITLHKTFDLVALLKGPACPYLPDGCVLQVFSATEGIGVPITLAFWIGAILASPVIFYQVWAFIAPALYKHERRIMRSVLAGGMVLFCLGVALAFLFALPATLRFAEYIGGPSLVQNYAARAYFSLVISLALTFGVAFEMPIVLMALTALGIVTPTFLRTYWRQALVLCVVAAAVITPGDALASTLLLVGPLYALYEFGIVLSRRAYRWRSQVAGAAGLISLWLVGRASAGRHAGRVESTA